MENVVQGFWHLKMQPGNTYDKSCDSPLHVTHAVIDTAQIRGKGDVDFIQVRVIHGQTPKAKEITVANLSLKRNILQAPVDLSFGADDMVKFRLTGAKFPVTLIGVMERVEEISDDEEDYDEDTEEFDVDPTDIVRGKRKAKSMNGVAGKRQRLDTTDQLLQQIKDDQSIVEESGDEDDYNPLNDEKMPADPELDNLPAEEEELQAPTSSEDEDEEEDEDDDSDAEEDVEDEGTTLDGEEFDSDDSDDEDVEMDEESSDSDHTPAKAPQANRSKLSKQSTPKPTKAASPKSAKKEGKIEKSKPESTPKQVAIKKAATPKTAAPPAKEATPKVKDLKDGKKGILKGTPDKLNSSKLEGGAQKKDVQMRAGGVTIEDISAGSGPVVKNGCMVSMYYRGTLMNGKEFDAKQSGKPFKFRLGKGEVIKGFDVGVLGMKVGGRRKLSVPAKMGYGKAGAPPVIPPNAQLNFDLTLVGLN